MRRPRISFLKRLGLFLALLCGLICAGLYFFATRLSENLLNSRLAGLGGQVELRTLGFSSTGIVAELAHYEDDNLRIEDGVLNIPWSNFWSSGRGYVASTQLERIEFRFDLEALKGVSAEFLLFRVVGKLNGLNFTSFEFEAQNVMLSESSRSLRHKLNVLFIRELAGVSDLSIEVSGDLVKVDLKSRVEASGRKFAADFVVGFHDWGQFGGSGSSLSNSLFADLGFSQIAIEPLAEKRGFAEASGYLRWNESNADSLQWAILADLGACNLSWSSAELNLGPSSIGLAGLGRSEIRAYANGGLGSMRSESWMHEGGEWGLRLQNNVLAAELRLTDLLELSLGHHDVDALMVGNGGLSYFLEGALPQLDIFQTLGWVEILENTQSVISVSSKGVLELDAWQIDPKLFGQAGQEGQVITEDLPLRLNAEFVHDSLGLLQRAFEYFRKI